jgi:hypothetical protein
LIGPIDGCLKMNEPIWDTPTNFTHAKIGWVDVMGQQLIIGEMETKRDSLIIKEKLFCSTLANRQANAESDVRGSLTCLVSSEIRWPYTASSDHLN